MANLVLPYSILKPDTNSDSPSEKSNGVRLSSAIEETLHKKNKGVIHSKIKEELNESLLKVKKGNIEKRANKIKANLIS